MEKIISPSKVSGKVSIPGSKSHTIRAILIASLAQGDSIISNPLYSLDTASCIQACRAFGAVIEEQENCLVIQGVGIDDFKNQENEISIDVGNSGTTLYLATAIAALRKGTTYFTGDNQIQDRSASPLLNSLEDLGAKITRLNNDNAPYKVQGPMLGGTTEIHCETSQYLSALLIACSLAEAQTNITVPLLNEIPYVIMTLDWLAKQNIKIQISNNYSNFIVEGKSSFKNFEETIMGDFSSATFFFCAPVITKSTLTIKNLDKNDTQGDKEVLNILQEMGAEITWQGNSVTVDAKNKEIKGIDIDLNKMPDALPALAITCAFAKGATKIHSVEHARAKETDRIKASAEILQKASIRVIEKKGGLIIEGGEFSECTIDSLGDHRLAMSAAIAGLGAEGPVRILNAEAAYVTFPNFYELIDKISN